MNPRTTQWTLHSDSSEIRQIHLQPSDQMNYRNPDEWLRWKWRFQQFREASRVSEPALRKQISTFLYSLGEVAKAILHLQMRQPKSAATTVMSSSSLTPPRFERTLSMNVCSSTRETSRVETTAEQYTCIMALYDLVKHCDYWTLKEEMNRDQLVVDIRDSVLLKKLQMDTVLTLKPVKKRFAGEKRSTNSSTWSKELTIQWMTQSWCHPP